jgi:signal transduction histidine kinase
VLVGIRIVQKLLNKKRSVIYLRNNLIYLITYGLLPVLISEAMVEAAGYEGDWVATLLISPIAPVLMIVLSLLRLTARDRSTILKILENSVDDLSANQPAQEQMESASVASYLHNSLQSELLALSKKLAEAAENPDKNKAAALLEQVAAITNRSIAEDFVKFAESPFERLADVIQSWRGILEIELDFDVKSLSQNEKAAIIVQTIEEVATNVARYDNATNLQVSAVNSDLGIALSFQSNGGGKLVKAQGLGSNWFDKVAVSQWSITKNQKGSLLIIEI